MDNPPLFKFVSNAALASNDKKTTLLCSIAFLCVGFLVGRKYGDPTDTAGVRTPLNKVASFAFVSSEHSNEEFVIRFESGQVVAIARQTSEFLHDLETGEYRRKITEHAIEMSADARATLNSIFAENPINYDVFQPKVKVGGKNRVEVILNDGQRFELFFFSFNPLNKGDGWNELEVLILEITEWIVNLSFTTQGQGFGPVTDVSLG